MSIGLVGCQKEGTLEVDDESSDAEIWEIVKDHVLERVDFGWERK